MTGVPRWKTSDVPWYENQHLTVYDIPQVGNWVGRVGHIVDIFGTPCNDQGDATIAFYATWNALPRLLLALYKPDRMDLVAKRWGGSHKRRTKRRFKIIDELIGQEPIPKGAGWAFFKLASDMAQRVGWYMLVVDATTDFAVNWTSAAYTYAGCRTPGAPYCTSHNLEGPTGPFAEGRFRWTSWIVQNEFIFAGDNDSIAIPPGYIYSVAASFQTAPLALPFQEAHVGGVELVNEADGAILATCKMNDGYDGKRYASMMYRQTTGLHPGQDVSVYITKTEGLFRTTETLFSATGTLDPGLNPDP